MGGSKRKSNWIFGKKGEATKSEFLPLCHSRSMDSFKAFQVRSDSHFRKITLKDDRWIRIGKIKARVSYVTTQFYIYTHLFDEYLGWQATLCQVWAKIVAMVRRGGEPKNNRHTYGPNRHQVLKWETVPGFWQVVDHTVCIVF